MKKIAASATAMLLVAIGAGFWLFQQASQEDSVQVWVKGRGTGQTIRLFPHGNYEGSRWCDTCPEDQQFGTWSNGSSAIILRTSSGQLITLNRIKFRGCDALTRADEPLPKLPTDVFFLSSDSCGDAL